MSEVYAYFKMATILVFSFKLAFNDEMICEMDHI